jgi:glycosyltransferase involved in cell wall biosynthesis
MKLAACLIVKNEKRYIERIILQIQPHVDGIFIYDTGSTDGTQEIARRAGCTVVDGEWRNDFAWARNRSYDLPDQDFDWIVYFDADDEVEGLDRLKPLAQDAASFVTAFRFPYDNDWSGIQVRYDTIRMVRRSAGYRWSHPLHEQLETDLPEHIVTLDTPVWRQKHTWQERQAKTQRNTDLLLSQWESTKNSRNDIQEEWLVSAIVLNMIEQGKGREAYQWMTDNGYVLDIYKASNTQYAS